MTTRFVFQPCKVREDRIVPLDDAPLVFTTRELIDRFVPQRDPLALRMLRSIRVNSYYGLIKNGAGDSVTNFVFMRDDRKNTLSFHLKKDPTVGERIVEVFRVDEVDWGSRFSEPDSGIKDRPAWERPKVKVAEEMRK